MGYPSAIMHSFKETSKSYSTYQNFHFSQVNKRKKKKKSNLPFSKLLIHAKYKHNIKAQ